MNSPNLKTAYLNSVEKKAAQLLVQKMGLGRKELEQINNQYGVSASQLVELMQFSKYPFVYQNPVPGQCRPCNHTDKINTARY